MPDSEPPPDERERSPEELEADFDAFWQIHCEEAEAGAEATGNPLFLWQLLKHWNSHGHSLRELRAPKDISPEELLALPVPRPPLPEWAQAWLASFAGGMDDLIGGRDPRKYPDHDVFDDAGLAAWRRWRFTATLDARQSAALVPLVLGLTREAGWNAFAEFDTIIRAQQAAEAKADLLNPWDSTPTPTRGEAHRHVMREYGFTEDRGFRRFLAKGQRVRPKAKGAEPPPEE